MNYDVAVIGGGAAGFFAAINCAEQNKNLRIVILEKSRQVLSKVRISGGGRCNVTNSVSEPVQLSKNYPRGGKEFIGPFYIFNSSHTVEWFLKHGVKLKTEGDGRIFPATDDSQTIIECFLNEAEKRGITIIRDFSAVSVAREKIWVISSAAGEEITAKKILIASGGSEKMWGVIKSFGHNIIEPLPSLFTFNCGGKNIAALAGVTVNNVIVSIEGLKFKEQGALLFTHRGLSGPAVLKLSAWGARELHKLNYKFTLVVNFVPSYNTESIKEQLNGLKKDIARQKVMPHPEFSIPARLWEKLCGSAGIDEHLIWNSISGKQLNSLAAALTANRIEVSGKSTNKEEFVTAGGVDLKEVNFKTMESKLHPGLFFAGEILNIDAVTGGFNFQAAWTTGYIAAKSMADKN